MQVLAILQRGDIIMSVLFTRRGPAPASSGGGGGGGIVASDLEIGSSVFLNVNGALKEFLIVHQGNPDPSLYDASCDGTWLLMKDIYTERILDSSDRDYKTSDIHAYLNGTFLGLFDANIQSTIKSVKIPYYGGGVKTGENGLSTQVFLLSMTEIDATAYGAITEGAALDYFVGSDYIDRYACFNGIAIDWWLRSPDKTGGDGRDQYQWYVRGAENMPTLGPGTSGCDSVKGIRPALILPSNAYFDPDTKEFVGVA